MRDRRSIVVQALSIIVLVGVVAAVTILLNQNDSDLIAATTTRPASTTTELRSATSPASSTTGEVTTTTTLTQTTTPAPPTSTVAARAPWTLVSVTSDGVYVDDLQVSEDVVTHAIAWADGTIVTQATPGWGFKWILPDGTGATANIDGEVRFVGGGTIDNQRVVLFIVEVPRSADRVPYIAQYLQWVNLDEYLAFLAREATSFRQGTIGVVGGWESGYSAISASQSGVAVGLAGEGLAGLQVYRLDGTEVPTGIPIDFELDAFVTPWISPDGKTIVSRAPERLEVWEVSTGERLASHPFPATDNPARVIGFDGQLAYVAVESDTGAMTTVTVDAADGTITEIGPGQITPVLPMP